MLEIDRSNNVPFCSSLERVVARGEVGFYGMVDLAIK